jgi:hypothetical protein
MKSKLIAFVLLFIAHASLGQTFFENAEGDELFISPDNVSNSRLLGKVNTTTESLEFRTFIGFTPVGKILPKKYLTVSIKGKPSDGIATLFNNGNFNTSTSASIGYIIVNPFTPTSAPIVANDKYSSFVVISAIGERNKYTLFRSDTTFATQISSKTFTATGLDFNYNALIRGTHLFSVSVGYRRGNNYSSLKAVELKDTKTYTDPSTNTTRTVTTTTNGRQGTYKEYNSYPLRVSYTYCPSEGATDKLKIGATGFISRNFGAPLSYTKLGGILFLTKVETGTGVRVPIIGLLVQADDFFDEANKNTALSDRVLVGLTTTFTIAQK